MKRSGFTLIEILVVIAIIASIVSLAIPNYLSARQRAQDTKYKSEMAQMKDALRLYNTDYHTYPAGPNGLSMSGCGANGTTACPCQAGTVDFAAGGSGCDIIYMKQFPTGFLSSITYYQVQNGDDFCMSVLLNNKSDPDITASQNRCRAACTSKYPNPNTKYWVCSD